MENENKNSSGHYLFVLACPTGYINCECNTECDPPSIDDIVRVQKEIKESEKLYWDPIVINFLKIS